MGKTRELFPSLQTRKLEIPRETLEIFLQSLDQKIRDTKGTFHAKTGRLKDRNGMDLTEAEDIKKWQEYTEELYKKVMSTMM